MDSIIDEGEKYIVGITYVYTNTRGRMEDAVVIQISWCCLFALTGCVHDYCTTKHKVSTSLLHFL